MCCRHLSMPISKVPNSEAIVTGLHVLVQKAIFGEQGQHRSNNSSICGSSISCVLVISEIELETIFDTASYNVFYYYNVINIVGTPGNE